MHFVCFSTYYHIHYNVTYFVVIFFFVFFVPLTNYSMFFFNDLPPSGFNVCDIVETTWVLLQCVIIIRRWTNDVKTFEKKNAVHSHTVRDHRVYMTMITASTLVLVFLCLFFFSIDVANFRQRSNDVRTCLCSIMNFITTELRQSNAIMTRRLGYINNGRNTLNGENVTKYAYFINFFFSSPFQPGHFTVIYNDSKKKRKKKKIYKNNLFCSLMFFLSSFIASYRIASAIIFMSSYLL